MEASSPVRFIIAGTAGDSGKTLVTTGLLLALRRREHRVSPFKKGPDYIDAAWLTQAAGRPCRNLDTYMQPADAIVANFRRHADGIAVVEGNRGLLDGMDLSGTHSTASLARLLKAPVFLVVNAAKVTRTVAAVVAGCKALEPEVNIAGVILNRVAGPRHEALVRQAVQDLAGVEVVGAMPKVRGAEMLPDRHLGLVTPAEHPAVGQSMQLLAELAERNLDIHRILALAGAAPPLDASAGANSDGDEGDKPDPPVNIGYFADTAFTFYYPENLEALSRAGSTLIPINSLEDPALPGDLDGLYIGGGFPETHARRLARNRALMKDVARAAEAGLPIFAECGGMIYLSRSLLLDGETHAMAGVLPLDLELCKRPQGHGYMELEVDRENPLFEVGQVLRAHEFHYTRVVAHDAGSLDLAFRVKRGTGTVEKRDGVVYKNVLAGYAHLHAIGTPKWAPALVGRAACHRELTTDEARRK